MASFVVASNGQVWRRSLSRYSLSCSRKIRGPVLADQQPSNPKTCVFCGNPPDNKTKEHVVPRWLIELTGDPKRTWNLGVRYGEEDGAKRERKFAADQFQFPACEACNSIYSDLEGRAKSMLRSRLQQSL